MLDLKGVTLDLKIKVEYLKIVEYPKIKAEYLKISRVSTVFSCDHLFCFTIASIHNRVLLCALEGSGRPGVSFLTILFCHLYIIVKEDFWPTDWNLVLELVGERVSDIDS